MTVTVCSTPDAICPFPVSTGAEERKVWVHRAGL